VHRDRELDHAEARAEVPAGRADRVDHLGAQLVGELAQVLALELAQVGGRVDGVEQRGFGPCSHGLRLHSGFDACR
jgi:hypothetical protein